MQSYTYLLASERQTKRLANILKDILQAGDLVLLKGDLGAGKSTLVRALIQSYLGENIKVPSPTFTLIQTYDLPRHQLSHFDLYRLNHPDEAEEIGLYEALEQDTCLIEWPERVPDLFNRNSLTLQIEITSEHQRRVELIPSSNEWQQRLDSAAKSIKAALSL